MDIKEVLKLADDIVFKNTGKHLDDLEQAILKGVLQNEKYSKIAEEFHCSEGHVKDVASDLWKRISDILGEDVSKSNLRSTIERQRFSIVSSNFAQDFVGIGNVNLCAKPLQPPEVSQDRSHHPKTQISLEDAPDISPFFGRSEELNQLEKAIAQQHSRIVTILGMSGIGKTALALQLVEQIKDKFEYVIWRSLHSKPLLEELQTNLIQFLSNQPENGLKLNINLSQLIEYLRKHRCLIILDDVHSIFSKGQLAGCYENSYENYGELFKKLGEIHHQSCLVLLSWDKPREVAKLEAENRQVCCLELPGLDLRSAKEILREKRLVEEEKWQELIEKYQGNPLWLKIIATMIQDLFAGRVGEFVKYDDLLLNEDLKDLLFQECDRLSEIEKQIISSIAEETEAVAISQILSHLQLPASDLINAMQSLGRRSLIAKINQSNETLFNLQPVVKQYVKVGVNEG
ncbi:NB-ARC domain-containing protein [Floridanema evergladense]|uniref:NB-ARC domain-containing protein n=1 Tax=Floridaenema evergladense BLCC-F167 TaxID=3153639 RepID=A0ABV4WS62_9CYAN